MKRCEILAIIVLGFAVQAAAAPPTPKSPPQNVASASVATPMKIFHWFAPVPSAKPAKIERVGKLSSQPWTQIVGWHPGASAFVTGQTAEPQLILLTVNF